MISTIKLFLCLITLMHPVHVSFTSIEYLKSQNEIIVSFQIFTDDFVLLFVHLYEVNLDLSDQKSYNKFKDKTDQYFNHHFKFKSGNESFKLLNNGYKTSEEFTWFYYRIKLSNDLPDEIIVQNTILFDLFFDQKNLLITKFHDNEQGHQFDIRNKEILISLQ